LGPPPGVAEQTRSNILFLVSDDQSWHSNGFAGDPLGKTPHLDRLAAEGVVFTRAAVTTSICMVIPASEGLCGKDWKYIRWVDSGTEELFDLRGDSHEASNLAPDPAHAADLTRLRARCSVLKKEVGGTPLEELQNMPSGIFKPVRSRTSGAGRGGGRSAQRQER
jgi:arylsulfatase A-like enzyme